MQSGCGLWVFFHLCVCSTSYTLRCLYRLLQYFAEEIMKGQRIWWGCWNIDTYNSNDVIGTNEYKDNDIYIRFYFFSAYCSFIRDDTSDCQPTYTRDARMFDSSPILCCKIINIYCHICYELKLSWLKLNPLSFRCERGHRSRRLCDLRITSLPYKLELSGIISSNTGFLASTIPYNSKVKWK